VQAASSFNPFRDFTGARARGCYTCEHWQGAFVAGNLACERDRPWRHVPSLPAWGCAHWMRATGADDE
jgi:hypothetical protein